MASGDGPRKKRLYFVGNPDHVTLEVGLQLGLGLVHGLGHACPPTSHASGLCFG